MLWEIGTPNISVSWHQRKAHHLSSGFIGGTAKPSWVVLIGKRTFKWFSRQYTWTGWGEGASAMVLVTRWFLNWLQGSSISVVHKYYHSS
jgi:hypothetical protein